MTHKDELEPTGRGRTFGHLVAQVNRLVRMVKAAQAGQLSWISGHGVANRRPPTRPGGAGARTIRFQILAAGPVLGAMAVECDSVRAEVLDVSCGSAGVSVGDEVSIWDPSRCHFNMPVEMLIGAVGMAVEMVSDLEGVVDCLYALQEEGECLWMVQSLCCTEDVYGAYGG